MPEDSPKKSLSLQEVLQGAEKNAGQSFVNTALAPIQPLLHPLTTARTFAQVADGLVSKGEDLVGVNQTPQQKSNREATVNAIGNFYKNRYGSIDNFKQSVADDPFGVLSDVASVLSFGTGALATAPGKVGAIGKALNVAAKAADATNALGWIGVRAPTAALNIAAKYAAPVTSGLTARALETARHAGLYGESAFSNILKDSDAAQTIVDTADSGLSKLKAVRDKKYASNMAYVKLNTTPIDYKPVYDALDEIDKPGGGYMASNGAIIDPQAQKTAQAIRDKVDEWYTNPLSSNNAFNFDELKRAIGNIQNQARHDPTISNAVASKMYNTVKSAISDQVPEYEKFMGDYSKASDALSELKSTLSLGPNANYSAGINKLYQAFSGGKGKELFDDISNVEPDLPYMLAGYGAKEVMPKDWARLTSPLMAGGLGTIGAMAAHHPVGLLAGVYGLAQSSPRFAAKTSEIGGKASALATKWSAPTQLGVNAARQIENANIERPLTLEEAGEQPGLFPVRAPTGAASAPEAQSVPAPTAATPTIDAPMTLDQAGNEFEANAPAEIEKIASSIKLHESGSYMGDYGKTGPMTSNGDQAIGAYQVMRSNIAPWTKEVLGHEMTPEQFQADADAQNQVAWAKIEQLYRKYGNAADVASVWHSGRPLAQAQTAQEHLAGGKLGTKTTDYAAAVAADAAKLGSYGSVQPTPQSTGGRITRAAGGQVGMTHEQLVNHLMTRAKQAKRATDNTTKPLLNAPDEAIVKALDVAQQAI